MPKRMKEGITQFVNCRLLINHCLIVDDLWVRQGKILNPEKVFFEERLAADVVVDCRGAIIAPGFIDVQINGAFGVDFTKASDNISAAVLEVAEGLLAHGVTSFCPTVITTSPETYKQLLPQYSRRLGGKHGAAVLGLHLEGPFISREKRGAHPEHHIQGFPQGIPDLLKIYGSLDNVSIVTVAPELPGADLVIPGLTQQGIAVSLGHSTANLQQGEQSVRQGAKFITHLFNAMLPFHHRDPHLVGLLASSEIPPDRTVFYGIIADGIHTHPASLRIAHRTHSKGIVLVTDAVPAMGLSTGQHHIGEQVVEIREKRALIAGTNTLCGSIATMNECVKFSYKETGCSRVEALEAASLHPAQMLGLDHVIGTLNYGADADLVLLDENLDLLSTFIHGELVWEKIPGTIAKQTSYRHKDTDMDECGL